MRNFKEHFSEENSFSLYPVTNITVLSICPITGLADLVNWQAGNQE